MSKTNTWENELLELYFNNAAAAGIGDASGLQPSAADGNVHVSLHTAWPGEGGNQSTSEATYTDYARQAVARDGAEWTVAGNNASNTNALTFPKATGGSETILFWGIGDDAAGAGKLRYVGHLGSRLGTACGEATGDTFTIPGHGLAVNDRIVFYEIDGASLPGGVTAGTVYWVVSVPDVNTITVSTTQGGGALNVTSDGVARAGEVSPLAVSVNVQPEFAAGELDVFED